MSDKPQKIQPRVVKGSRDFLPEQVRRRKYLLDVIRGVFARFGFEEIETPAMELLETLTGKYGEEGDKLLFRILNSGDFLSKADEEAVRSKDSRQLAVQIAEKGLRYDLTVPLARYVVQHQNELVFPFRRYHIGPVWRADRPQRGRYREFYQCDADIIGSDSLLCEAELTRMLISAFKGLGIPVRIEVNHRGILEAIVGRTGLTDKYQQVLVAIDKLDKIGRVKVAEELAGSGIDPKSIDQLFDYFETTDMDALDAKLGDGIKGIADLRSVLEKVGDASVRFSPALARGLDYYTGTIWEVKAEYADMGTIAAGGRYDDLTELFGGRDMSGVGISFGVERIYDILEESGGFPDDIAVSTRALIINFDEASEQAGWSLLQELRDRNVAAEIYPASAKLKKQMAYADKKNIPYVIFLGAEEMAAGNVTLKHMASGEQSAVPRTPIDQLIERISG